MATVDRSGAAESHESRRERKKRQTRQAISDAATRLFRAAGFEEVTLAEIAEAAEVSVKTIFNHFHGKEDLYFDRAAEVREVLLRALEQGAAGGSALAGLRELLLENFVPFPGSQWSQLEDERRYEGFRGFLSVEQRSAALRAHRLVIEDGYRAAILDALAEELGRDREDPALRVLAAMLLAALRLRERTLRAAVLERHPPAEVRRRVEAIVREAFDRIERAFEDLDGRI